MSWFILEGTRPGTIFCFALIHYVWICEILSTWLCFCARSRPKNEQKQCSGVWKHTSLLTAHELSLRDILHWGADPVLRQDALITCWLWRHHCDTIWVTRGQQIHHYGPSVLDVLTFWGRQKITGFTVKKYPKLNICLWSYVNSFAQIESVCTFKVGLRS